jgi:hypothetical protein
MKQIIIFNNLSLAFLLLLRQGLYQKSITSIILYRAQGHVSIYTQDIKFIFNLTQQQVFQNLYI